MSIEITAPLTADELNNVGTTDKVTPAIPIMPVPIDAPKPTKLVEFYNKQFGMQKPTSWYIYRNKTGEVLGYIMRWNFVKDGKPDKEIRPFCYCEFPSREKKWHSCGFPEPRPLYNLHEICKNPDKAILVCEGEKVVEAARKLFPDHVVTTSCGGSNVALKTDWSLMKGRNVFIAIDHDKAGQQYGDDVYHLCKEAGAKSIKLLSPEIFGQYAIEDERIVEHQRELPVGYDLADALQEGWTADLVEELEIIFQEKGESLFVNYPEPICDNRICDDEWPDPQLIKSELLPVESFDILLLPEPLQDYVADIAHRMQCPIDYVAITTIIMFSSLIGAGCGIRPKKSDDWCVISNLWGGIVGAPGTLKSPALEEALKPINLLESKSHKNHEVAMQSYQEGLNESESFSKKRKGVEKLTKPICRRFKTNDPTIPKLGELLKQNPRGLLISKDELVGLLKAWDKKGNEADRAFMLTTWNGYGSNTSDRIERGTIHSDNMCISIVGGTQPSKLLSYLQEAVSNIGNDGLAQRFQLLVYPDEKCTWEYIDQAPNLKARKRVSEIAEKIASLDFTQYGATVAEDSNTPYFHFADDAQTFFINWHTEHETTKVRNSKDSSIIIEHLSKYRSLMPSLALIFHITDIVGGKIKPGPVTLESAQRAAAWCDYLESHARRIYGIVLNKTNVSHEIVPHSAMIVSEKIKDGSLKDGFSLRDVYRKGWTSIGNNPEIAKIACDFLVQIEWLKVQKNKTDRGQAIEIYRINPKIDGVA